jgi:hypothetical protein
VVLSVRRGYRLVGRVRDPNAVFEDAARIRHGCAHLIAASISRTVGGFPFGNARLVCAVQWLRRWGAPVAERPALRQHVYARCGRRAVNVLSRMRNGRNEMCRQSILKESPPPNGYCTLCLRDAQSAGNVSRADNTKYASNELLPYVRSVPDKIGPGVSHFPVCNAAPGPSRELGLCPLERLSFSRGSEDFVLLRMR